MSEAYTGGCACGAIRYEITAEPIVMNDCQCRECQRKSGTGHGSYLTFPQAAVKPRARRHIGTWSAIAATSRPAPSVPTCGSPVYLTFPAMPEIFIVHAGSLDDPTRYKPQVVLWTAARSGLGPSRSGLAKIRQDAAEVNA